VQDLVEQRRLAAAEKAGEDGRGNEAVAGRLPFGLSPGLTRCLCLILCHRPTPLDRSAAARHRAPRAAPAAVLAGLTPARRPDCTLRRLATSGARATLPKPGHFGAGSPAFKGPGGPVWRVNPDPGAAARAGEPRRRPPRGAGNPGRYRSAWW